MARLARRHDGGGGARWPWWRRSFFPLSLSISHGGTVAGALGDGGLEVAAVTSKLRPVLYRRFALGLAGVARSSPAWSGRRGSGDGCGRRPAVEWTRGGYRQAAAAAPDWPRRLGAEEDDAERG
uniref:Uncharacterized protein n=1 Tax=Oryza meridionalis TaxID=40149 RepID=A0A0E0F6Z0_9ORYZ